MNITITTPGVISDDADVGLKLEMSITDIKGNSRTHERSFTIKGHQLDSQEWQDDWYQMERARQARLNVTEAALRNADARTTATFLGMCDRIATDEMTEYVNRHFPGQM